VTAASKHKDDLQLGVVFAVASFQQYEQGGMSERIAWLKDVYYSIPHSAIAWIFPDGFPGVVLIARTYAKHVLVHPGACEARGAGSGS
jgi:hypothetical protein